MKSIIYLLLTINLFANSHNEIEYDSCQSYVLVCSDDIYWGFDYGADVEVVFLLGSDFSSDSISVFCKEVIQVYASKNKRKKEFVASGYSGNWQSEEEILTTLKYPILYNNCYNDDAFERLSSGEVVETILIPKKKFEGLYLHEEEGNDHFSFKIIRHEW